MFDTVFMKLFCMLLEVSPRPHWFLSVSDYHRTLVLDQVGVTHCNN
jgi:hypothetical protein